MCNITTPHVIQERTAKKPQNWIFFYLISVNLTDNIIIQFRSWKKLHTTKKYKKHIISPLTSAINESIKQNQFPDLLKIAKIIFVFRWKIITYNGRYVYKCFWRGMFLMTILEKQEIFSIQTSMKKNNFVDIWKLEIFLGELIKIYK